MSVGNIREDSDNSKQLLTLENDPCKVLDCIINPDICREMKKKSDNELLSFFADLLVAYVS